MKRCIACGGKLEKLLYIENMPATAQDIPDANEVKTEKGIDLHLCQCDGCGLVQLDTPPVSYYRDVIRAGGYSTTMDALRRKQYDEFIEVCHLQGKKILEAGSGQGEFLKIWSDYPVKAYGMEHKRELVEKARSIGLQVQEYYPNSEEDVFENAPFDAFTSFNFLEHQPDPAMYLRAIAHNLVDGGYGLLTVPSFEYILEQESFYEIIPDHIAYYTRESLHFILDRAGFLVLKEERVNRDTLAVIIQKKPKVNVDGLLKQKKVIQDEVYDLMASVEREGKRIAVWGASHQGFTLCATMHLDKIAYIIDSAPFKQGRFAPASHIPIVSPAAAKENPVDVIVIVAPGYTDEIAQNIREKLGEQIEIYTLMSDHLTRYKEKQ